MGGAPLRHPPAHHPPGCRLLGPAPHRLDPRHPSCRRCHPLEPQAPEKPLVLAAHLDQRGTRQTQCDRTLLWPRLPLFSFTTSASLGLVGLTYTASIIVGLAAQQAGRPELIRSPKRVLAHCWEAL